VQRYDKGTLSPAKRRADGTVVAEAHFSRSGTQTYANKDGSSRVEYRPPDEVSAPASLDSFKLVPVTDDHPPELLSSSNARQYSVGSTGNDVRADDDHVIGSVAVHDAKTIAKMEAGKLQVSCGYECDLDETPGVTPDGVRYDAVQRNIRGNHLAIVQRGRADSARIRLDSAFRIDEPAPSAQRNDIMDLTQALAALATAQEKFGAEKARADAAIATSTATKVELDKLTARHDELTLKFDAADKARKDAVDAGPTLVRARVALETKAAPILGKDFKMDGVDDRAIQLAVIKAVSKVDVAADKSADYVSARFDAAIERAATSTEVFQAANRLITSNRADSPVMDAAQTARAEMVAFNRSQHVAK